MQISQTYHRVPSFKSPIDFLRPPADQDVCTQNSFAAISHRSAFSSNNQPNSSASDCDHYPIPPTTPSRPSASLGQLDSRRKRLADPWAASTRGNKAFRGGTYSDAQPSTTAVIDKIMDPLLRREARAEARGYPSDDDGTSQHHDESPVQHTSYEQFSDTAGVPTLAQDSHFGQPQIGPTPRLSQNRKGSRMLASSNSMYATTRNRVPSSKAEQDATRRIEAHNQKYRDAMVKYETGMDEKSREEGKEYALQNLCF